MNLTNRFIDKIYEVASSDMGDEELRLARNCFLDYIGVTIAGANMMKCNSSIDLSPFFRQKGNCRAIGYDEKITMESAAVINGMCSHIIELDDGHRYGMIHPGGPVISALLSVAQVHDVSKDEFYRGIVTGYEGAVRIAEIVQPTHKKNGYHASGTCGTIGAALGIGAMCHYSRDEMKSTLAAAATTASGILEMIDNISELKPYNVGSAAANGITSAMIGKAGFKSPHDPLFGKRGFVSVMSNRNTEEEYNHDHELCIKRIYVKPYAACRHCHAPIECALSIKKNKDIETDNIDEIEVLTYSLAVGGHEHREIVSVNSAKMSIPYSVAVALIKNKANISDFSQEAIADSGVMDLARKVTVREDAQMTELVPDMRMASLKIKMKDGSEVMAKVEYPKGEPENPLKADELKEKFFELAMSGGKTKEDCQIILDSITDEKVSLMELIGRI